MLERLPCIFAGCHFGFDYHVYQFFQKFNKSRCCEYKLTEHREDS